MSILSEAAVCPSPEHTQEKVARRGGRREGRRRGDGLRCCQGCGRARVPTHLCRVTLGVDGGLLVDLARREGGRGVHLCFERGCIELAVKKRRLGKALRGPSPGLSSGDLTEKVRQAVEDRARRTLARAGASGFVVSDWKRLQAALCANGISFVLVCAKESELRERLQEVGGTIPPLYRGLRLEIADADFLAPWVGLRPGRLTRDLERDLQHLLALSAGMVRGRV